MKIGIHKYRIVYKEMEDCGEVDRTKNIISIKKDMSESEKLVTLWHEILHVINGELSETLVESLAQQLSSVLKENKQCYNERHNKLKK